jgi:hypothetical protein
MAESSDYPLCTSERACYTSPDRVFGTVGNTDDTSPDAHTVRGSLGRVIMAFARLSVSRNSFVRFSSIPINSDYFALILANTTNPVGFS